MWDNKTYSVADKVVRTKMCPQPMRLVVMCKKPKASEPYKSFCVFTSDRKLPVEEVITHYKNRWKIETAFRDVKQNFGFGTYQVQNRESLNRHVQFNFVAAGLTQLCWLKTTTGTTSNLSSETEDAVLDLDAILQTLRIHWYKPKYVTLGLIVDYLQHCFHEQSFLQQYFSVSNDPKHNSKKNLKIVEDML